MQWPWRNILSICIQTKKQSQFFHLYLTAASMVESNQRWQIIGNNSESSAISRLFSWRDRGLEWIFKNSYLKFNSSPEIEPPKKNDLEGAELVLIFPNTWPFWFASSTLTVVEYNYQNVDHFRIWVRSDRIFCQGHCTLTMLHYVCRISSLGACNGAFFMA